MRYLAIETSTTRGSLALLEDGSLRCEAPFPEGLIHGREITARLAAALDEAGWTAPSLGGIAVSVGPGSYTGIRVGVTAAKTLSFGLRIPVLPESTLRVLAAGALAEGGSFPSLAIAALDGRQGYVFWAAFESLPGEVRRLTPDAVTAAEDLEAGRSPGLELLVAGRPAVVVGDGAGAFLRAAGGSAWRHAGPGLDAPRAGRLGELAWPALREAVFDSELSHGLEPVYLRAPECVLRQGRAAAGA